MKLKMFRTVIFTHTARTRIPSTNEYSLRLY